MAFQTVDTVTTTDTLQDGMDKVNSNFTVAQAYLDDIFIVGEFKSDGTLVYPSGVQQTVHYTSDGSIEYFSTTNPYLSKSWTLTYSYDSDGNIDLITANDGGVSGPWTRTLTYSNGILQTIGDWTP